MKKKRPEIDLKTGRYLRHDHAGKKYGHLTFLRPGKRFYWVCRCDCGKITEVRFGRGISCGCYRAESARLRAPHGKSKTKEFRAWAGMRSRCKHNSNPCFKYYGGKGIKVCERWNKSFTNFLEDMGDAPSRNHSIDRIDGTKGYSRENCRWATNLQQGSNRANSRLFTYSEETLSVSQWAARYGVNKHTIRSRLRRGSSIGQAIGAD